MTETLLATRPSEGPDFGAFLDPALIRLLQTLNRRLVVVGAVACGNTKPDGLEFLWDVSSRRAAQQIGTAIRASGLDYETPAPGCWEFSADDYGFRVRIRPSQPDRPYRACRGHARQRTIAGMTLWVARKNDA